MSIRATRPCLVGGAGVWLLASSAAASLVLTVPTREGVVVCADKRKTLPDCHVATDEALKLRPLGNTHLIFSVGGAEVQNSGRIVFDANGIFSRVFNETGGEPADRIHERFVELVLQHKHILTDPLPQEIDPRTGRRHAFSTVHLWIDRGGFRMQKVRFDCSDNSDLFYSIEERPPARMIWPFGKHIVYHSVRAAIRRDNKYRRLTPLLDLEKSEGLSAEQAEEYARSLIRLSSEHQGEFQDGCSDIGPSVDCGIMRVGGGYQEIYRSAEHRSRMLFIILSCCVVLLLSLAALRRVLKSKANRSRRSGWTSHR